MRARARVGVALAVVAVVGTACAEPPPQQQQQQQAQNADFRACMVTDSGGINDKSFNATSYDGIQQAADKLGITPDYIESEKNSDYVPNIETFVEANCGIVVTVGFLLGDATLEAAKDNLKENFAIVDYGYEGAPPNLKSLLFNTAEAAFLAGYLSAGMTETGKVATYGGIELPTVTIFMDGFWEGVQHYNEAKGADVQVLGWNEEAQKGSFTGDFEDQNKGKVLSEGFINQGADIIMPVAGPVGLGTIAAAESAKDVKVIWVDTDGCESLPESACPLLLTSVIKGMDTAVFEAIQSALQGNFSGEPYVGTLQNGGVEIAPYHEFEDEIPAQLKSEIEQLRKDIISGKVKITSPSAIQ